MALIECPECGGKVSTEASSCPHCGCPTQKQSNANSEIERLLNQIIPTEFKCPEPRAKVCIKCGTPYFYGTDYLSQKYATPDCNCSIEGHPYPSVEVDFPECDSNINFQCSTVWIYEECVDPRNIGDKTSHEYISARDAFYNSVLKGEELRRMRGEQNWKVIKQPPDQSRFGVTPQQMMERRKSTQRPVYTPPAPKPSNVPTCPICKSTSLTKITTAKKAGKIALFGIFGAGDVGKTWRCNNCGSKF